MPNLTGTIADVTGTDLSPAQIRQVFVKAPGERPSLADGGVLIVSAPVQLGSSGSLSVTLEPGPAVLTVDTVAGGPDVYDLYVTADMTLLSEAIDEAAPERDRSWAESVMVQLRAEAVAAAAAAAEDRQQTGLDRVATAEDRQQTGLDRVATAEDRVQAGIERWAAVDERWAAVDARNQAIGAKDDTIVVRGEVESLRAAAGTSADEAAEHADRAEAAANEFGLTATSSTLAPGAAATVTVSGDGPAYQVAFGVPQGPKGDKGDDGEISQAQLDAAVASLVDGAPEALDTLTKLAAALGNDPNFATTVSTEIGKRALVDGAPAAYNTLGKLVAALQNHELGGSTDASLLTGALTGQVDASEAMVDTPTGAMGLTVWLGGLFNNLMWLGGDDGLGAKADTNHTHPVSDLNTTGTASSTTYLRGDGSWATPPNTAAQVGAVARAGTAVTLWSGTQAQYNALAAATRNAAGFIAVIA